MPELSPELVQALGAGGGGLVLLYIVYLFYAQAQKTKRTRMISQSKDVDEV